MGFMSYLIVDRTLLKGIVILLSFVIQAVVIYIVSLLLSRYVH